MKKILFVLICLVILFGCKEAYYENFKYDIKALWFKEIKTTKESGSVVGLFPIFIGTYSKIENERTEYFCYVKFEDGYKKITIPSNRCYFNELEDRETEPYLLVRYFKDSDYYIINTLTVPNTKIFYPAFKNYNNYMKLEYIFYLPKDTINERYIVE